MKSYIVHYQRIIFQKINASYLTVPSFDEMHQVHTVALGVEDTLVLHTPMIRGYKTCACLAPYLLLVHVSKFLVDRFSPFHARTCIGIVPGFCKVSRFFRYRLAVSGHHSQIDEKIKFFMAPFSCIACLISLLALSLYKAWSIFKAHTTFALIVVWGIALTWLSISLSKKLLSSFLKSSLLELFWDC